MAEPTTPRRPGVKLAERDGLLATKLHVPRSRAELLSRARLLERLTEGMAHELTLVCTPAGFGKTTLLADWARASPSPVAWLSLDEGDNDPARFWRHVAAALDAARSGIADRIAPLLQGLQPASVEALAATLVNELAELAEEVVLVLDDYHLLQAPPVHASVEFLLEHLPPALRLVVASRADPPLPLARLRARGQLAELRQRDLRFTPTEAAELLRAAVGPDLPEAAVVALADRTEGWEVLDRQHQPLRWFLLETSVLERLCGPLCDAVTGRADSQQLLEQVERANLFLIPLDEQRRWWRVSPPVRRPAARPPAAATAAAGAGAAPGRGHLVRGTWLGG
jgi:LuxR family maltose regulon positive regulatory protein